MVLVPIFKGDSDPRQFLMAYEATVTSIGGDDITLAKAFTCAPEGPALTWYFNVSVKSRYSWENLRDKVTSSFRAFIVVKDSKHTLKGIA